MIFKNAMSFKAKIKQIAEEKGLSTQQVQQSYLIETFLVKLSNSEYKDNFIVKGGYLISGIVGLDMRSTMDLDITIKGFELIPDKLREIVKEIVKTPTDESFLLNFESLEEIRETGDYSGFRLKMVANFEKIREVVTVDITIGDVITPREIDFSFKKIFNEENIELLSYPIETILAEKLETILSRGIGTTRPRDYYDVYILSKLKKNQIDSNKLKQALFHTKNKRHSVFNFNDYLFILDQIRNSTFQKQLWSKYQKQYSYAKNTSFDEVISASENILAYTLRDN